MVGVLSRCGVWVGVLGWCRCCRVEQGGVRVTEGRLEDLSLIVLSVVLSSRRAEPAVILLYRPLLSCSLSCYLPRSLSLSLLRSLVPLSFIITVSRPSRSHHRCLSSLSLSSSLSLVPLSLILTVSPSSLHLISSLLSLFLSLHPPSLITWSPPLLSL